MGNLEKAGIAVVVVLLAVILVVAFMNDPAESNQDSTPKRGDKEVAAGKGTEAAKPADQLASKRSTDGDSPAEVISPRELTNGGLANREDGDAKNTASPFRDVQRSNPGTGGNSGKTEVVGEGPDGKSREVLDAPVGAPVTAIGYPKEVKLLQGQNIWSLVVAEYGAKNSDLMMKRVMDENGIKDPKSIKVNTTLRLPAPPESNLALAGGPSPVKSEPTEDPTTPPDSGRTVLEPKTTPKSKKSPAISARARAPVSEFVPFDPGPQSYSETPRSSSGSGSATRARTYVMKNGESLEGVARRELGSARRAQEIANLNRIKDKDRVPAGTKLRLPNP